LVANGQKSLHPLQQAVFDAVYASVQQRALRAGLVVLLVVKHVLRGTLFLWPAFLVGFIGLRHGSAVMQGVLLVMIVPATAVAAHICGKGILSDYRNKVSGRILSLAMVAGVLGLRRHESA